MSRHTPSLAIKTGLSEDFQYQLEKEGLSVDYQYHLETVYKQQYETSYQGDNFEHSNKNMKICLAITCLGNHW